MIARPSGRMIILLLASVAILGSLGTQMLVPALPLLAGELGTSVAGAQLVVSFYLAALGAGQLVAGPLADRIGRKPVLLSGLLLFVMGCAGGAAAANMGQLLAARLIQAAGASAGVVTARVMVGDFFSAEEAAGKQAMLMAVVMISPAIAPVIGGLITELLGWRAIFAVLALGSVAAALLTWLRLPESRTVGSQSTQGLVAAYAGLFRNRAFLTNTVALAAGSATLYTFLTAAPFLFETHFGLGPRDGGLVLLVPAVTSMAGTKLVGRLDRKGHGLPVGAALSAGGAMLLALFALAGLDGLVWVLLPIGVTGLGAGILGPSGITNIIRSAPSAEGTASSLAGASQMLISATVAALLGHYGAKGPMQLGMAMCLCSAVTLTAALWRKG